jgi:hypothetical protein
MAMIPQAEDADALVSPVMAKGRKAPMKMKTPGMGTMMGAPKYKGLASMGKIEAGDTPFTASQGMKKGGSVSKRADGCCVKGKTKGKML